MGGGSQMNKEKQRFEQLRNEIFEMLFSSLIEEEEGRKLTHRELSQRMREETLAVNTSRYLYKSR